MKIYVTGIAGMLGSAIYRVLKRKAAVFGNDIAQVQDRGLMYSRISLFDLEAVERDILQHGTEVLVHTAAMVDVDRCEEEPETAARMNAGVTALLAEMCSRYRVKMVYISTDAVFDGEKEGLYTEQDQTAPVNVYGRTKLEGEQAVLQYPENLVLRTNIYGKNVQNKKSFGEWIYDSLTEGKHLDMFTDIYFSPILADELAELVYLACVQKLSGIYHACGTGCISKYEFGTKLREIFQIPTGSISPAVSESASFKAKRAKHMGMSNRKLCDRLQVRISTPEESILKFYDLLRQAQAAL